MKPLIALITVGLIVILSLVAGANATQFDYSQFEGLPYTLPLVIISSPSVNGVYNVPDVPFNVTVQTRSIIYPGNNERLRELNYSLDGHVPISIPVTLIMPPNLMPPYDYNGNGVLTNLTDGNHTLIIYGETFVGGLNGYFNETVSFTVNQSIIPEPVSLPTSIAIVSVVTIAVVGLGRLVYHRKRRSETELQ